MLLRILVAGLFAAVLTFQVIRTAWVGSYAEEQPAKAAALWPNHPEVLRSVAMAGVGDAAGRSELPPPATLRQFEQLAQAAPLVPEPFLVHGALAQKTGDNRRAEQLLLQARQRDPRSLAARFLVADLYRRTGRTVEGLGELPVLGRLVPGGIRQLAPSFAAFATTAGAVPQLQRIIRRYPEVRDALLQELSADPKNADLVLAIAGPTAQADQGAGWQQTLIKGLVKQGEYDRAYAVWARVSGVPGDQNRGLFNPSFAPSDALPPFNWSLASKSGGVAEFGNGGLSVLYFGRDYMVLASQLMLLSSGRYQLQTQVAGSGGEASQIAWFIKCARSGRELVRIPVGPGGSLASFSGKFEVPPEGCDAQRIELVGIGGDFPERADFRITGVEIERVGG